MAQPGTESTFLEHIGVIAWVVGMFYLFLKKMYEVFVKAPKGPESQHRYHEEEAEKEREVWVERKEEVVVHKKPIPPPQIPKKPKTVDSPVYEVKKREHTSRGADLIKRQKSLRDLFIIDEIIKPPVSMRTEEWK